MQEQLIDLGATGVIFAGMGFVLLGMVQYLAAFSKRQDKRRQEIFKQLEKCHLANIELTGDLDELQRKYKVACRAATKYKKLYEASIQP